MAAEAGLKPYECDRMSPNDIWVCIEGYEERMKGEWERMRITAYTIHAHSMADKKHKKNSPQKFFPLPWDKGATEVKVAKSPQEILEWHRKLREKNKANTKTQDAG
jgi:uncharacterized protein YeeX (DUF496 family)